MTKQSPEIPIASHQLALLWSSKASFLRNYQELYFGTSFKIKTMWL